MKHAIYVLFTAVWHSQLLGVVVGVYAARQWQARQWRLESAKAEYRELLTTLSRSAHYIMSNSPHLGLAFPIAHSGEQERLSHEADVDARIVIADRIFIANRMQAERVSELWAVIGASKDGNEFWMKWRELHDKLVGWARKDLGLQHQPFRRW